MDFTIEIVTNDGTYQHPITEAEACTKLIYEFVDSWCFKQNLQPHKYCLMRNKYILPSNATFDTVVVNSKRLVCCILPVPRLLKAQEQLYNHMPISLQSVKDLSLIITYLMLHHNNIFAYKRVKEISDGMLLSIIEVEAKVGNLVYAKMTQLDCMQEITKVAKQKLINVYDNIWTEIVNMPATLSPHTGKDVHSTL